MSDGQGQHESSESDLPPINPADKAAEAAAEAAADAGPGHVDKSDPDHDPYAHLRPYRWKKGQSGNPGGMKKGTRSLSARIRHAASIDAGALSAFKAIAVRFGLSEKEVERMDIADVLAISMFYHATRGKGIPLQELVATMRETLHVPKVDGTDGEIDVERAKAIAFYQALIDSDETSIESKLKARAAMDKIHGLVSADTISLSTEDAAEAIRDAISEMDATVDGDGEKSKAPEGSPVSERTTR